MRRRARRRSPQNQSWASPSGRAPSCLASDGQPVPGCREKELAFLTESVLTETSPAARPGREGDWTLTLRAAGGEEETYILWQEGERLYWAPAAGGEAWLAGASPEELAGVFQP